MVAVNYIEYSPDSRDLVSEADWSTEDTITQLGKFLDPDAVEEAATIIEIALDTDRVVVLSSLREFL